MNDADASSRRSWPAVRVPPPVVSASASRTMALHSAARLYVVNAVTQPLMHDLTKTTCIGGTPFSTVLATTF